MFEVSENDAAVDGKRDMEGSHKWTRDGSVVENS